VKALFQAFQNLFEHPIKIGLIALLLAFTSLLAEGTLIDLWSLKREKQRLQNRYQELKTYSHDLQGRLLQAKNSDGFIGRQARDKLDLVKEDELVFIFENDNVTETPAATR
jgi:cell division protein FtsB